MTVLQFFDNHPFLALIAIICLFSLAAAPFRLISRFIGHLNIRKAGWPTNPNMDSVGNIEQASRNTEEPKP